MLDPTEFIASRRWRFAATMPDWPHEYTVRAWLPAAEADFVGFCELIEIHGIREAWPPPPMAPVYRHTYWVLGSHKYWPWVRMAIAIPSMR